MWIRALLIGLLVTSGMIFVNAGPALADTTLCSGNSFSTCINAGRTAHGYESHYASSYWKAYAGHNCTNYVGYMLTLNGDAGHGVAMGNAAQWDDTINAHPSWGYAVNSTPTVGSIAQWEGGAGHVAYVEAVGDNSITVSEDNYPSGPFRWRTITTSGDWPDHFLHIKDVVGNGSIDTGTTRIGILNSGQLDVKEGIVGAMWTTVGGGSTFELSSNRIAVYNGSGLDVKEGGLGATWTTVTGQVDEFHITDNRIGIRVGTQIFIKEGSIGAQWVHVADGTSFAMSSNRLAVYDGNWLNVKEGNIYAGWTTITGQVDEFHITDNRIGIRVGSVISVKDGPIGAQWTHVADGVSFAMSSNRLAVYSGSGLDVKEGPLNAAWVTVTGNVSAFDVTDTRVGFLLSGQLFVKSGPLNATWVHVAAGQAFDLT